MHIVVGSTNPVKVKASRTVLKAVYPDMTLASYDAPSGVPDQPWGNSQTRRGAYQRAQAVLAATTADLAVGLEGGVQPTEFGLMTCAWCVIMARDGRMGVGGSACTLLPPAVASHLRQGRELGQAMDALSGRHNTKQGAGAIGLLTDGLLSRQAAYEAIVTMALSPFLCPEWYPIRTFA